MKGFSHSDKIMDVLGFVCNAHAGQKYGDVPYFTHPLAVAQLMIDIFDATDNEVCIALLHDVVEDTRFDIENIEERFGSEIAIGVALLTKDDELSYEENIKRIVDSKNLSAIRVKFCDNRINMAGDKSDMSDERRIKLETRYAKSVKTLGKACNE